MKMKKEDREIFLKQIFWEVVGSAFIAGSIYNFAVQAGFPMTGFSGISIILYQLFGVPVGFSTILLNIPVAILCYRLLGRHFFFSSLRCMLISSLMIDYVAPLLPVYSGDRLLGGTLYRCVCRTGICGDLHAEFLDRWFRLYYYGSQESETILVCRENFVRDGCDHHSSGRISASGCGWNYLRNDCEFLLAIVVDKLMYGINSGKMTLVVTEHGKEICDVIDSCCGRGSTILQGQGGYRCDNKQVVMCVCNNKEMYLLQHAVKEADPASFMIILESNEVHGEGFRTIRIGEGETQAKNSAV